MPGYHTKKQKRMARHIYETAKRGGHDHAAAERIAWATVASFKKASAIEYNTDLTNDGGAAKQTASTAPAAPKPSTSTPSAPKLAPTSTVATANAAPGNVLRMTKGETPSMNEQFRILNDKIRRRARKKAKIAKAGESAMPGAAAGRDARATLARRAFKNQLAAAVSTKHGGTGLSQKRGTASWRNVNVHDKPASTAPKKLPGDDAPAKKSFEVVSISDYHSEMVKAGEAPAPGAQPAPKRFPRGDKPTIKMKPISDGEAMANLKAGKFHEKSLRTLVAIKALIAGYGRSGGADVLRAPNRAPLSVHDLNRAMEAMPKPTGAVPPATTYLPGVHGPEVKQRAAKIRAQAKKKQAAAAP